MNQVLLTGRLTRDPDVRKLASGKTVTQFGIATNDYRGGSEKSEYHTVVTWDRLAEICGQYLGKGQLVSIAGRLQTRQWEDDEKKRHWKTEIVASSVEMLSGKKKKDYAAESAAEALAAQAAALGYATDAASFSDSAIADDDDEDADAEAAAAAADDEEELVAA
jgi:single-strand DNA-binding protein